MESTFGVTVNRKIMEVSDDDFLLIKRMIGTYCQVIDRFLEALKSEELRCYAAKKPYALRNELVSFLKERKKDPDNFPAVLRQLHEEHRHVLAQLLAYISTIPLQARHWKLALEEANVTVAGYWGRVAMLAQKRIKHSPWYAKITEREKGYVMWLLQPSSQQFFEVLSGRTPRTSFNNLVKHGFDAKMIDWIVSTFPVAEFVKSLPPQPKPVIPESSIQTPTDDKSKKLELSQNQLVQKVAKALKRVRHHESFPKVKKVNRIDFDCECWTGDTEFIRVDNEPKLVQYVELMTDQPRKRLHLRLKGNGPLRGTLQLQIDRYGQLVLHVFVPSQEGKLREAGDILSLDAGAKAMVHDQYGNHYGEEIHLVTQKHLNRQNIRQAGRNRCFARKRVYEKRGTKASIQKAQRIKENNLGRKRFNKEEFRWKETCKCLINRVLNKLLKPFIVHADGTVEGVQELVIEHLGKMRFNGKKKFSKKWKQEITSGWLRHYIHERIVFKCKKYGIKLTEVNPACTSVRCSVCGCVNNTTRDGDKFTCHNCGHTEHADTNAAKNILARKNWAEETLFLPPRKVREKLEKEFEKASGAQLQKQT